MVHGNNTPQKRVTKSPCFDKDNHGAILLGMRWKIKFKTSKTGWLTAVINVIINKLESLDIHMVQSSKTQKSKKSPISPRRMNRLTRILRVREKIANYKYCKTLRKIVSCYFEMNDTNDSKG